MVTACEGKEVSETRTGLPANDRADIYSTRPWARLTRAEQAAGRVDSFFSEARRTEKGNCDP